MTSARDDLPRPATDPALPTVPVLTAVPPIGSGALATLTWDDGTCHGIYRRTVVGRDPQRAAGTDTIVLRDETLTLSRTHFELSHDDEARLCIANLDATNGIVIARGGESVVVVAGERRRVVSGDRLVLGDRWVRIEVAR